MKNLLLSAAIGDIAGMPYEFKGRTKDYNSVNLLLPSNTYTDDTVCTFACAEALLKGIDMAENLWNRCRADFYRGFGGRFARWLIARSTAFVSLLRQWQWHESFCCWLYGKKCRGVHRLGNKDCTTNA